MLKKEKKKRFGFCAAPSIVKKAQEIAAQKDISFSKLISNALSKIIKEVENG